MIIKPELAEAFTDTATVAAEDFYANGIVTFAVRWAELLEAEIARRELIPGGLQDNWSEDERDAYILGVTKVIEECAKDACSTADTEFITGNMYAAAVALLGQFWEYGWCLARWHNRRYLSEEQAAEADEDGGVVNPAIWVASD